MLYMCYAKTDSVLSAEKYHEYFALLPEEMQNQNGRYKQWNDRAANLLGKVLLMNCLDKLGLNRSLLHAVHYNAYRRPYISAGFDFNITHTAAYVMCAICNTAQIGIDMELIRPVDFEDFSHVMTPQQWHEISTAQNPCKEFFKYWTIKESVIKADGRGLSFPLTEILFSNNMAVVGGKQWYLQELAIDSEYAAHLASNRKINQWLIEPWTPDR